jgi:hypothetical protein
MMDFNKNELDSFFNDDNQEIEEEKPYFIKKYQNKNDNKILKNCMKYIDEHEEYINEIYEAVETVPELIMKARNECFDSIKTVLGLVKQQNNLIVLQRMENEEKYEQKMHELNFTTCINKIKLIDLMSNQEITESELRTQMELIESKLKSQEFKNKILMNMINKTNEENIKLQFSNQILLKQIKDLSKRVEKLENRK